MLSILHNIPCPTLPFPVLDLCSAVLDHTPTPPVFWPCPPVLLYPPLSMRALCRAICMAHPLPLLPLPFGARSWDFPSALARPSFWLSYPYPLWLYMHYAEHQAQQGRAMRGLVGSAAKTAAPQP